MIRRRSPLAAVVLAVAACAHGRPAASPPEAARAAPFRDRYHSRVRSVDPWRRRNAIENMNGSLRRIARNVKRWKDEAMIRRWVALGIAEAQRGFRRVKGYENMPSLLAAYVPPPRRWPSARRSRRNLFTPPPLPKVQQTTGHSLERWRMAALQRCSRVASRRSSTVCSSSWTISVAASSPQGT